jgi:hypothetical protein
LLWSCCGSAASVRVATRASVRAKSKASD